MFKEIYISNFRSFKSVNIKRFGDVNIIAGGNGTGKSTLLEAVFLNAGGNNALLSLTLNNLRGDDEVHVNNDSVFHALFNDLDANEVISINSKYQMPNKMFVSRNLEIRPMLKQKSSVGETGVNVFVNGLEFKFGIRKNLSKKEKSVSGNITFEDIGEKLPFSHTKVDESSLLPCRYVSPMVRTIREISDRLSSVVKSKNINNVIRLLNIIDPRIKNLTSISENGRNEVYVDIGLDRLMPATYMGGGFMRMLYLAISMHSDKIILIDEIENGLHYTTHKPLLNFIFNAAKEQNCQIFLTTHSLEFLDNFISVMSEYENLTISAYRCYRENNKALVSLYSREEMGLREQLDIELR